MTNNLLNEYRTLMNELLIMREADGGELPVEVESAYVERLNDLWWQLSEEDQHTYEAELSTSSAPASQEDLNLVDCDVAYDDKLVPRRKAA